MRYAFVIAPPRCGSTLLTRILCQHPDVEFTSELHSLMPGHKDSVFHEGSRKLHWHGFTEAQRMRWAAQSFNGRELLFEGWRASMREMLDDFGRRAGAQVVGDSWPFYCHHLGMLLRAFPDAKLVFAVRDPRGAYCSGEQFYSRTKAKGQGTLDHLLAYEWELEKRKDQVDAFVVRYEDLVRDPGPAMRSAWEFLGVDPDKGWLRYDGERDRFPERWAWVPNATHEPDPSRADRWRDEMPPETILKVSRQAQDLSRRYGYEVWPGSEVPEGEVLQRFMRGQPLSELGGAAEEIVRKHVNQMARVIDTAVRGLKAACDAVDKGVEQDTDAIEASAFRRYYRLGRASGKALVGGLMGHLHNRIMREVSR